MDLQKELRYLRLPYMRTHFNELISKAEEKKMSYEEFLLHAIEQESRSRHQNGINFRIDQAHFPDKKRLADFKTDHLSDGVKSHIRELSTLEFIDEKRNVIFFGNPGCGKTCLSCCLGIEVCLKERSVLFIKAADLMIDIEENMSKETFSRYKKRFLSFDLVIIDEFSFLPYTGEATELLFNLISARSGNGAMILTSNIPLSQWDQLFDDPLLVGALADRLAHCSYQINMSGPSYRRMETKEWLESKKNSKA